MWTRTTALPVAALALAVALVGCGSDGEGQSPSPTDSPTAGAVSGGGGTYADTDEILAALESNGVPCEEPQEGSFPEVSDAKSCIVNGSEDIILLSFASDAERENYVAKKDELASAVLGENWAIQTVLPETAEQVADAIGGELLLGES